MRISNASVNLALKLSKRANQDFIRIIERNEHWFIFPFKLHNQTIETMAGYKPNNFQAIDYGEIKEVFSSYSSIIATWDRSTHLDLPSVSTGIQVNRYDKFYTVRNDDNNRENDPLKRYARWFKGYIISDQGGLSVSSYKAMNVFTQMETKRTYTLTMTEQLLEEDRRKFYVVLNGKYEDIGTGKPYQNQSRQWLYISNIDNYFNPISNEFVFATVTFSSINDMFSKTGPSVDQFIQNGSIGEGYAFPKIINDFISIDYVLAQDLGARYFAFQKYGVAINYALQLRGRPTLRGEKSIKVVSGNKDSATMIKNRVFPPRRIFFGGDWKTNPASGKTYDGPILPAINDEITTANNPVSNWVFITNTSLTGYEQYADNWQQYLTKQEYQYTIPVQFKGLVEYTHLLVGNQIDLSGATPQTNSTPQAEKKPAKPTAYQAVYNFFEKDFTSSFTNDLEDTFDVRNNYAFSSVVALTPEGGRSFLNVPTYTMKYAYTDASLLNKGINPHVLWNLQGMALENVYQLPLNFKEWLPLTGGSIPIIGKYLNQLGLGQIAGGAVDKSTVGFSKISSLTGIGDAVMLKAFSTMFYGTTGTWPEEYSPPEKKYRMPLNFFDLNSDEGMSKVIGAHARTIGATLKLTDKIKDFQYYEANKPASPTEDIKNWGSPVAETQNKCYSSLDIGQPRLQNDKYYIINGDCITPTSEGFLDMETALTFPEPQNTSWEDLQFNPTYNGISTSPFPNDDYCYIIDTIIDWSFYLGQVRYTAFSDNPFTNPNGLQGTSIWSNRILSKAAFTNSFLDFCSIYHTNYDEYNENQGVPFNYPQKQLPPTDTTARPFLIVTPSIAPVHVGTSVSNQEFSTASSDTIDLTQLILQNNNIEIKDLQAFKQFFKGGFAINLTDEITTEIHSETYQDQSSLQYYYTTATQARIDDFEDLNNGLHYNKKDKTLNFSSWDGIKIDFNKTPHSVIPEHHLVNYGYMYYQIDNAAYLTEDYWYLNDNDRSFYNSLSEIHFQINSQWNNADVGTQGKNIYDGNSFNSAFSFHMWNDDTTGNLKLELNLVNLWARLSTTIAYYDRQKVLSSIQGKIDTNLFKVSIKNIVFKTH